MINALKVIQVAVMLTVNENTKSIKIRAEIAQNKLIEQLFSC